MEPNNVMQQPAAQQSAPGKKSHVAILVIVIIIVAIAAAAYGYWFLTANREQVQEIEPGVVMRTARPGRVVSGFPVELIPGLLPEKLRPTESFSIQYSQGNFMQPVLTYSLDGNLPEVISEMYGELETAEWDILHVASSREAPVTYFYAKKDNRDVNITLEEQADDNQVAVRVTYVIR